jgi:TRAP-type C4-dicarboxylate transport system permease large subunit
VATLKNRFRLSYPPTEGGAMGAVGALALAILHRRLTWKLLKEAMDTTLKLITMVMFILVGSTVFSLTFRGVDGDLWVEGMLSNLPGGVVGFLIFVNVFVFFLAFFLDYFEIAFIIIPLLGAGGREDGDRPDLVRSPDRGEHADLVHASALRLCVVLSALHRSALDQK